MEEATNDDAGNEDDDEEEEDDTFGNTEDESIMKVATEQQLSWFGFKIVGDNVDKNICASFQRSDHGTCSLHHFYSFTSRDRLDFSNFLDKDPDLSTIIGDIDVDAQEFLPSEEEIDIVKEEFSILIARYVFWYNITVGRVLITRFLIVCFSIARNQ